jgi:hypothetical protein
MIHETHEKHEKKIKIIRVNSCNSWASFFHRLWVSARPSCRPSSTTPHTGNKKKKFIITHPLHPFHGQEFESINYRHGSKISSISFYDSNGGSHFVPVEWTDIFPEDPFLKISGGRSLFRYEDLVDLFHLIETMESELSKK